MYYLIFCSNNSLKMRDKSMYEKAAAKDDRAASRICTLKV